MGRIKYYAVNCFVLMLPVMLWNVLLASKLPPYFQPAIFNNNIPALIVAAENISRALVFLMTLLMPLSPVTQQQKTGLLLYVAGVLIYFSSWLALIYFPHSNWSTSVFGFLAPAYTPLLWLTGIALTGSRFYFNITYRRWYFMAACIIFLLFHNVHTFLVFKQVFA